MGFGNPTKLVCYSFTIFI